MDDRKVQAWVLQNSSGSFPDRNGKLFNKSRKVLSMDVLISYFLHASSFDFFLFQFLSPEKLELSLQFRYKAMIRFELQKIRGK